MNTRKTLTCHYLIWALLVFLPCLSSCVHRTSGTTAEAVPPGQNILRLRGTILHKSSHLQTITLALAGEDKNEKKTIAFDFRTRGMEYVARGREVDIRCRNQARIDKPCKALTIMPAEQDVPEGLATMTSRALKKKIDAHRDITLVDTRPASAYARCHIPGALSLPACGPDVSARLRQLDHDSTLILYCGWQGCSQSLRLARQALSMKDAPFEEIMILEKGLDGWIDEGLTTVAEDSFVLSGKRILLDLRPARKNTVQRIPGSISLPAPLLKERISELPHEAPIIIYGDTLQQSLAALTLLRENGFTRAAMVAGDFHGWKKRHNPVTSGPITTAIRWQHPLRPGEIGAATLRKKMRQRSGIVIDLRSDVERKRQGIIRGSIALPLDRLHSELGRLDRRKTIYCISGARAELAREILIANGFTALYLAEDRLDCDGRNCTIKKGLP